MTTPDTHPEENDNRTGSSVSRRSYLRGNCSWVARNSHIHGRCRIDIDPTERVPYFRSPTPRVVHLLPSIDVDEAFDAVRSPGDGPTPRDRIACNGFWAGNDQDEPLWVAGSSACVVVFRRTRSRQQRRQYHGSIASSLTSTTPRRGLTGILTGNMRRVIHSGNGAQGSTLTRHI